MKHKTLLVDMNIIVDCLQHRPINLEETQLLLALGKVGEFNLWMSISQLTDLVFILSHGGKKQLIQPVLAELRKLTTFVRIYENKKADAQAMLGTDWADPEDRLLYEVAKQLCADAIISNNAEDFEDDAIPVYNSAEFFAWLKESEGIAYRVMKSGA